MSTTQVVERCTCESMEVRITGKNDQETAEAVSTIAMLDVYFAQFAKPTGKCLNCGAMLGGMFGNFRWGLTHGEGNCRCGWPARAYHRPKDDKGEEIFDGPLKMILQYHPDNVSTKQDDDE